MYRFALLAIVWGQNPYFQQRVEYFIQATLYPKENLLRGYIRFTYTNNSPDTLQGLYIHLWPNAYSRRGTAFDRQQRITGKKRFYFARSEERGFIDSLDFRVGGQPVKPLPAVQGPPPAPGYSRALLRHAPDVIWLPLPQPLPPKGQVTVETPFRVQVPITFSRMGRSGPQFQITQWYPKPAVYDRKGWHPLPYLDQGEFYSEWGRYEVELSVPENFIVGATGVLQTPEEYARLQTRIQETADWLKKAASYASRDTLRSPGLSLRIMRGPKSSTPRNLPLFPRWAQDTLPSPTYKTLRFVQDSVHDFAWFADPRYGIVTDTVTLANGHRVACIGLFRLPYYEAWQYSARYIAEAIQKLSQWVGPYPYAHATAVEGGLEAGGGMEYPMITVIIPTTDTASLRDIIAHEVGHNWFQGILASNERLHPWQDEGINSYYEQRIVSPPTPTTQDTGTSGSPRLIISGQRIPLPISSKGRLLGHPMMTFYHHLNADQPFSLSSEKYSLIAYALGVYQRTQNILRYFVSQVGEGLWDKGMQRYFREWAFRHPYPEDWVGSLSAEGLPAASLLHALYSDREPDFRLKARKIAPTQYRLRIETSPKGYWQGIPLSAIATDKDQRPLAEYHLPTDSTFTLTLPENTRFFCINPEQVLFERKTNNNFFYTRGLFRRWQRPVVSLSPLQLPAMGYIGIGVTPVVGYNYRDGLMAGLLINHGLFPKRLLEFHVLPMYSFLAGEVRGSAGLTVRAFPSGAVQLVEARLRTATFAGFWRSKASIEATFRRRYEVFGWRHIVRLRTHHLAYATEQPYTYTWENAGRPAYVALDWEGRREEAILTIASSASVGHDLRGHWRAEAESRLSWEALPKWRLWARGYAGWVQTGAPDYLLFRPSGYDPFGERVLIDRFREGPTRLTRQQMPETQGAWRTPSDTLRTTTLLATNLELPLPVWRLLVLRIDAGLLPVEKRSYWGLSVGLPVIRLWPDLLIGGYFPVLGSSYTHGRPTTLTQVLQNFTWSVEIPLHLRWLRGLW